jgi:hypothetical protein
MWIITIYRGSPELNLDGWNVLYVQSSHPITAAYAAIPMETEDFKFYKNMENDYVTGYHGVFQNDATSNAVAWTGPPLDTFSFVWNKASPTVEIGHIGITRFQ